MTMIRNISVPAVALAVLGLILSVSMLVPQSASAAVSPRAFLGGGNALSRATGGQSQGLTNAHPTSNLLANLTLAAGRSGRGDTTPPPTPSPQEDDEQAPSAQAVLPAAAGGAGNNGGTVSGNGGNGGIGATGGFVSAGNVVSSANAVNVLNTVIIRIGR